VIITFIVIAVIFVWIVGVLATLGLNALLVELWDHTEYMEDAVDVVLLWPLHLAFYFWLHVWYTGKLLLTGERG